MGKFLTVLDVQPTGGYEGGRSLWQLVNPLVFESDVVKDSVHVPEGFLTDFASVPRLPFVYLLMADTGHPAAVVHDYLYRTGAYPRHVCDLVFHEALAAVGVSFWRRKLMHAAVRVGGAFSYKRKKV